MKRFIYLLFALLTLSHYLTPCALGGNQRQKRKKHKHPTTQIEEAPIIVTFALTLEDLENLPLRGSGIFHEIRNDDTPASPTLPIFYVFLKTANEKIINNFNDETPNTLILLQVPLEKLIEYYKNYNKTLQLFKYTKIHWFDYANPIWTLYTPISLNFFHPTFKNQITLIFLGFSNEPSNTLVVQHLQLAGIIKSLIEAPYEELSQINTLIKNPHKDMESSLHKLSKTNPFFQYIACPTTIKKDNPFYTPYKIITGLISNLASLSQWVNKYNNHQTLVFEKENKNHLYSDYTLIIHDLLALYDTLNNAWSNDLHPDELMKMGQSLTWIQALINFHFTWICMQLTRFDQIQLIDLLTTLLQLSKKSDTQTIKLFIQNIQNKLTTSDYNFLACNNLNSNQIKNIQKLYSTCIKRLTGCDLEEDDKNKKSLLNSLNTYSDLYNQLLNCNNQDVLLFLNQIMGAFNIYEIPNRLFIKLLITSYSIASMQQITHTHVIMNNLITIPSIEKQIAAFLSKNPDFDPFNPPYLSEEMATLRTIADCDECIPDEAFLKLIRGEPTYTLPTQHMCEERYQQLCQEYDKLDNELKMLKAQEAYEKALKEQQNNNETSILPFPSNEGLDLAACVTPPPPPPNGTFPQIPSWGPPHPINSNHSSNSRIEVIIPPGPHTLPALIQAILNLGTHSIIK